MNSSITHLREKRPYRAVVAGFCASAASGMVLLFTHIVAKIISKGFGSIPLVEALLANGLTDLAGSNFYLAIGLHFVIGIGLALLFVQIREHLPDKSMEAILVFMTVPFLASVFVLFPLTGGGFLGLQYGAGLLPAAGSLILHAVYGATMVGLYEKMGTLSQNLVNEPARTPGRRASMRYAAGGILYGCAAGFTVAVCAYFLGGQSLQVAGLPNDFTFMSLIFFFSAMGLLVGFWTGAPAKDTKRVAA